MSEVKMNALLAEMRVMAARAQSETEKVSLTSPNEAEKVGPNFSEVFSNAINTVNDFQKSAGSMRTAFEKGDPNVTLPEVMIAAQKSSVAFTAMKEVRNKLVTAYQEIMNMPV